MLSWDECNSSKVDLTDADSFDKIDSLSDDGSENITGQEVDVSVDRMISDDNSVDDFDQEEE